LVDAHSGPAAMQVCYSRWSSTIACHLSSMSRDLCLRLTMLHCWHPPGEGQFVDDHVRRRGRRQGRRYRKLWGQIIVRHMCATGESSNPSPSGGLRKLRAQSAHHATWSTIRGHLVCARGSARPQPCGRATAEREHTHLTAQRALLMLRRGWCGSLKANRRELVEWTERLEPVYGDLQCVQRGLLLLDEEPLLVLDRAFRRERWPRWHW
jgi:hypothetical protein